MTIHHPDKLARSQKTQKTLPAKPLVWLDACLARLLRHRFGNLDHGHLFICLPSSLCLELGQPKTEPIHITIHSYRVLWPLLSAHPLSLSESYLQGHWSCSNLTALLKIFQDNRSLLHGLAGKNKWISLLAKLYHLSRANTKQGSRRNIHDHYDLGNEFYALWLDETMSYSSAYKLLKEKEPNLKAAQKCKYARILDLAKVQDKSKILEIGCGWGSMAIEAAKAGHQVNAITLSSEQLTFAQERIQQQNRQDRVQLSLCDYRDVKGQYDAILSIEMLEAVGKANWPTYFRQIKERLKPGGRAVIQVIVMADEHYAFYEKNVDFIQRHIFPGGFLPCPRAIKEQIAAQSLTLEHEEYFGQDYEITLKHWRKAFLGNWPAIKNLGFDERFKRLWTYYLCYCEAGFAKKSINVGFFVLQKPND